MACEQWLPEYVVFFLDAMLLPIWNHPIDGPSGTNNPAPQATACAHSGDIALTYVCIFFMLSKRVYT